MGHYYPSLKMGKLRLGRFSKITQVASAGGVACVWFQNPCFEPFISHTDCARQLISREKASRSRRWVVTERTLGSRELCGPQRNHCQVLVIRVAGHGYRSIFCPSRRGRSERLHAVSKEWPTLNPHGAMPSSCASWRLPGQRWKSSPWRWVCPGPWRVEAPIDPSWPQQSLQWCPLGSLGSQVPGMVQPGLPTWAPCHPTAPRRQGEGSCSPAPWVVSSPSASVGHTPL